MRRKARRANHGHASRRPRFETFEDRRMLSFTPGVTYDTGASGSWDVVTADFNNDGHLDLATQTAVHDGTVSVLLGDGQGGFGRRHCSTLAITPGPWRSATSTRMASSTWRRPPWATTLPTSCRASASSWATATARSSLLSRSPPSGPQSPSRWETSMPMAIWISASAPPILVTIPMRASTWATEQAISRRLKASGYIDGIFESATAADLNGDGADDLVLADGQRGDGSSRLPRWRCVRLLATVRRSALRHGC